jgi:hypothetical protein
MLYGDQPESRQVHTLMKAAQFARDQKMNLSISFFRNVWPAVLGSLRGMRGDVEAGLVGDIERRAAGEVLADMLSLAKAALEEPRSLNVAAVLVAASFEDTIRKMGSSLAGVAGRPDLDKVLQALKTAKVLTGPTFSTAQGFLPFRNHALHADWEKVTAAVIGSCLAFVERLILDHLS